MVDIAARQRETYEALYRLDDAPFIAERPALFSPAAAAQDDANLKGCFGRFAQILLPLEYTNWVEESVAHVQSCYLGDWTSLNKVRVQGRQALEFLSQAGLNDLSRFEIGQIKHHVQLDENGWVASEGILLRLGPEEFMYTAGSCDWLAWRLRQGGWDADLTDISPDQFIFGVQGPTSLFALEQATGESLRDIGFNRSREAQVGGMRVRVLRTGVSGELGYEVHGPADDANEVWRAILAGGTESGIRQLGFRAQPVHTSRPASRPTGSTTCPRRSSRQGRRGSSGPARWAAASCPATG